MTLDFFIISIFIEIYIVESSPDGYVGSGLGVRDLALRKIDARMPSSRHQRADAVRFDGHAQRWPRDWFPTTAIGIANNWLSASSVSARPSISASDTGDPLG